MNEYELATDSALRDAAVRYGARVHAKVRIADVVDIRELTGTVRSYALRAHFDFIVADADGNPLLPSNLTAHLMTVIQKSSAATR